jgi:Icc-related predicted phosphoesterase
MKLLGKIFNNHGLKVHHISDTHQHHDMLELPKGIDILIHSGDHGNYKDLARNSNEVLKSIQWLARQDVKHKIAIAGNHDTSVEAGFMTKTEFESHGIIYLENEEVIIEGLKFYGSPATPKFGDWAFMYDAQLIQAVWNMIPPDTDILITHGPPKEVLDKAYKGNSSDIDFCGCPHLLKRVQEIKPRWHLFGHIHNNRDLQNAGILFSEHTAFSNGSVVTDRQFGKVTSHGNSFSIKKKS